jgi:hypothetical protein
MEKLRLTLGIISLLLFVHHSVGHDSHSSSSSMSRLVTLYHENTSLKVKGQNVSWSTGRPTIYSEYL